MGEPLLPLADGRRLVPVGRGPTSSPDRSDASSDSPSRPTPAFSARFDTDDPRLARVLLRRYAGSAVQLLPARSGFRFRVGSTGDGDVSLRSSSASALISGPFDFRDQYVVLWLTAGSGAVDLGDGETPLAIGRPVLLPPGRVTLHLDDARLNHIHFRSAFLDRVAADLRLPGTAPRGSVSGALPAEDRLASWTTAVRGAARVLLDPEVLVAPRDRRSHDVQLAAVTVQTFARWASAPEDDLPVLAPRVQRAIAYIEGSARRQISTDDIAAAAGLSARGLQQAFRRDLRMTPHDYLRDVRLARVRQELLQSSAGRATSPTGVTASVSATATRWGFTHLGRFSAAYRARFDELPSTTLRR